MSGKVIQYLENKISTNEYSESLNKILDYYKKRLIHQLTEEHIKFLEENRNSNLDCYEFFHIVIEDSYKRMNLTSLARIMVIIAAIMKDKNIDEAIDFLSNNISKIEEDSSAIVITKCYLAKLKLYKKELVNANKILMEMNKLLEKINGVTKAHVYYYNSVLYYYFLTDEYESFYNDSLKYYSLEDSNIIKIDDDDMNRQHHTCISALLSPYVINLGAMIHNKFISEELEKSHQDLFNFVKALDAADIETLTSLKHVVENNELLSKSINVVDEKIRLISILNLSYECILQNIDLSFDLVAQKASIDLSLVEYYLIRAISLGIIKGSIDQVKKVINLKWVKPKFLSREQINDLMISMDNWGQKVKYTIDNLSEISTSVSLDKCIPLFAL